MKWKEDLQCTCVIVNSLHIWPLCIDCERSYCSNYDMHIVVIIMDTYYWSGPVSEILEGRGATRCTFSPLVAQVSCNWALGWKGDVILDCGGPQPNGDVAQCGLEAYAWNQAAVRGRVSSTRCASTKIPGTIILPPPPPPRGRGQSFSDRQGFPEVTVRVKPQKGSLANRMNDWMRPLSLSYLLSLF